MWHDTNIYTDYRLYQVSVVRALTPDFQYRISHDLPLPDQPYSLSIVDHPSPIFSRTRDYLWGELLNDYKSYFSMRSNDPLWSSGFAACLDKLDKLQAGRRNKLLAKVKGQSLPLLMLYKERHETGKLVTKFLDDMLFCARHIRNPKAILNRYGYKKPLGPMRSIAKLRRFASRGTTTIGQAWMQYRFAWSPFLADIADSLNAAAASEKKGISSKVTAGLPFEFTHVRSSRRQDGAVGQTGTFSMKGGFHITCRYLITDATLAMAAQIQNLEFTAWDSMPYSFLIDRLVNIGKYLDLRYATAGVGFSSGHETTFYECNAQYDKQNVYDYNQNLVDRSDPYCYVTDYSGPPKKSVSLNRTLLTAFPEPTLEYPYKDFFGNAARIADVATLVLQRFSLKT